MHLAHNRQGKLQVREENEFNQTILKRTSAGEGPHELLGRISNEHSYIEKGWLLRIYQNSDLKISSKGVAVRGKKSSW